MAFLEKVCEYSGSYPGPDMYKHKRDHIQIMPEHRKEFTHKDHVLYVKRGYETYHATGGFISSLEQAYYKDRVFTHNGDWFMWGAWCGKPGYESYKKIRVRKEYTYDLYVPSLPGRVRGHYINQTRSLGSLKRRLKRMLKCRKLNVVWVDTLPNTNEY